MRSRYSAFALGLADYILATAFTGVHRNWEELLAFSQQTQFKNLIIREFQEKGTTASVTFTAVLTQQGRDASFTEKSEFEKVDGRWLYKRGNILE